MPGQQQQVSYTPGMRERNAAQAKKSVQPGTVAAHGKQSTSIINNTQNSALSQNPNLQNALTSPQLTQTTHIPDSLAASSGTINFSLNSQQIQKLQGQLSSTSTNLLPQSSNPGSSIQINSVSHLTSLLANSNVTAPPNVNVHQIQQGQNVIGITGQSLNSLGQSVQNITQNVVNVQNIGITNQNMNNSNIQSLLGNALGTSMVGEESINMSNGPVSTVITASQNTVTNSNSTVVSKFAIIFTSIYMTPKWYDLVLPFSASPTDTTFIEGITTSSCYKSSNKCSGYKLDEFGSAVSSSTSCPASGKQFKQCQCSTIDE